MTNDNGVLCMMCIKAEDVRPEDDDYVYPTTLEEGTVCKECGALYKKSGPPFWFYPPALEAMKEAGDVTK